MIADYILTIFLTLLISGGVVAVLFPSIVRFATKNNFYDLPDDRHIHVGKVPRLGGVPFMPAMIIAIFVAFTTNHHFTSTAGVDQYFLPMKQLLVAGIGALIMYLTGLADDLSGVRYRYKFITQTTSAALMCASGVWIDNLHGFFGIYDIPVWLGVPLTIMLVMLIVNSVNLIDGIDGLASGLCIVGISAFAALFAYCGYYRFLIVAIAAIGCLLPFYFYNVFGEVGKNKMFLGDTGSLFIGYLLAFFAIKTTTIPYGLSIMGGHSFFLIYAYSMLLVPVFDVLRVFLKRIRRSRNPFLPDKTHIHHKFLALGFSMRQARWAIFTVAVFFFVMNMMLCAWYVNVTFIMLIDVVIWCSGHMLMTKMIIKRYESPDIVTINTDLVTW